MKRLLLLFIGATLIGSCSQQTAPKSKDDKINQQVDSLLSQMTYQEKMGQLTQKVVFQIDEQLKEEIREGKVGSILVQYDVITGPEVRNALQKLAVEDSRLHIPIIFGQDVIHGFRTIFPICLAQSCTWEPKLTTEIDSTTAVEATTYGVNWAFAPMIDISRDPRWGRIAECFGEDTYLDSRFAAAAVKGYQGEDVSQPDRMVSCLKHFVGYGAAMGGRDYQYTEISERTMHEVYLPPFKAGVDAGVLTVMSAFNDIDGVPASANTEYLRKELKDKWHFKGFVVSDWDAVAQLIQHGYASDSISAGIKALNAGIDMEMKSGVFPKIPQDRIAPKVLDEAVRRVLYVKIRKGLFKHPYTDENRVKTDLLTPAHKKLARDIASQTMVLLQNKNQVLPISEKVKNIAAVGRFAKEQNLMGWWRSNGNKADVVTPFAGLVANAPEHIRVTDKITSSTDVIIACIGEDYNMFGENHSRYSIKLPYDQDSFIQSLKKYGKPIVTVVFNGRPLNLNVEKENTDAILLAWHPGTEAGNALADVLYGKVNPSAKLTTSFPAATGDIPVYYNHRNSGRPKSNNYSGESAKPLYPFGFGLSYTSFNYSDLKLSSGKMQRDGSIAISAQITNTGKRPGTDIVQLYVHDLAGSTTRPVKELKGFQKIQLNPGESKEVSFNLKATDLAVLNKNMVPVVEPGQFDIWIAPDSQHGLESHFQIVSNEQEQSQR